MNKPDPAHRLPDAPPDPTEAAAPLASHRSSVRPEWIDYNGHMNVAYYLYAFEEATDGLLALLGADPAAMAAAGRAFVLTEGHLTYDREVLEGDPLAFRTQILSWDGSRLHLFHRMEHAEAGFTASTHEAVLVHQDLASGAALRAGAALDAALGRLAAAHAALPVPEECGRAIGLARKR